MTHLNTNFREVDLHGELLPGVYVRVVGLFERSLELVQLVGREGCPVATVLLLASVTVYVLPAACAELLVAAAAGGVAAVLTWKPRQRESGQVSSETIVTGNRSGNGDRFIRSRSYYPHYARIIVAIRSAATRGRAESRARVRAC